MENEKPVHDEDCPVIVYGLPDVICTCGAVPHRPPTPALRKAAEQYLAIQRDRAEKEKASLDELTRENARLMAALKPFAAIKPFEPGYVYWVVLGTPDRCSFTHNDLMAAREIVASNNIDSAT